MRIKDLICAILPALTAITIICCVLGFTGNQPSHDELARKVLTLQGTETTYRKMLTALICRNDLYDTIGIDEIQLAEEEIIFIQNTWTMMEPKLINLYRENFTPEQMTDLIRFYRSETGKHLAGIQTEITAQSMTMGQDVILQCLEDNGWE